MAKPIIGHKIIHIESVDSTNNYTAKVFKSGDIDSGTVIMADIQTNGRGQRNNNWQSAPYENITMSFPLQLESLKSTPLIGLNYAIGLAINDFLASYVDTISLKWPNDVMVKDKKIAGILIESQYAGEELKSSIIGIGININQTKFDVSGSTSLKLETNTPYQPKLIVFELINTLNNRLNELNKGNYQALKKDFDNLLWNRGIKRTFKNLLLKEKFKGIIHSTTNNGDLVIMIGESKVNFKNGTIDYLR